jgi:hypothetical protein
MIIIDQLVYFFNTYTSLGIVVVFLSFFCFRCAFLNGSSYSATVSSPTFSSMPSNGFLLEVDS